MFWNWVRYFPSGSKDWSTTSSWLEISLLNLLLINLDRILLYGNEPRRIPKGFGRLGNILMTNGGVGGLSVNRHQKTEGLSQSKGKCENQEKSLMV